MRSGEPQPASTERARLTKAAVRKGMAALIERGLVGTCSIIDPEIISSTRTAASTAVCPFVPEG